MLLTFVPCRGAVDVELRQAHDLLLKHLPQLDRLVVGRQQHATARRRSAPPHFVDLFLNLLRLEVVKLGLVALELGQVAVLKGRGAGEGALVGTDRGLWWHAWKASQAALPFTTPARV